jgi:DNA-binding MarR family transcriptional regulator
MDRLLERLSVDALEWRILLALMDADLAGEAMPATSVALACGTSSSAGLRRIAALEARGLLERVEDPADGRRALLHITEPGRTLCQDAIQAIAAWRTRT